MLSYRNITGAFSDSAVLFPLLALLATQNGASPVVLLFSAGITYGLVGFFFKVPMPVQPLKSIVLSAVALGATSTEVQWSGALIGIYGLLAVFLKWDRLVRQVPLFLVHGLQIGLGILMILNGLLCLGPFSDYAWSTLLIYGIILCCVLYLTERKSFPVLGIIATLGLLWGMVFETAPISFLAPEHHLPQSIRPELMFLLVIPQLILTSANSVIGAEIVAKKYFGERANRVTAKHLLLSIGFGNLATAVLGGLPFCHGAGGLTAHVKGGSDHWISNWIIGIFLMLLAGIGWWFPSLILFNVPKRIIALLLISVGLLHMQLAAPSWQDTNNHHKPVLVLMAIAAGLTQNMLWVLGVGVFWFISTKWFSKRVVKI